MSDYIAIRRSHRRIRNRNLRRRGHRGLGFLCCSVYRCVVRRRRDRSCRRVCLYRGDSFRRDRSRYRRAVRRWRKRRSPLGTSAPIHFINIFEVVAVADKPNQIHFGLEHSTLSHVPPTSRRFGQQHRISGCYPRPSSESGTSRSDRSNRTHLHNLINVVQPFDRTRIVDIPTPGRQTFNRKYPETANPEHDPRSGYIRTLTIHEPVDVDVCGAVGL